MLVLVLLLLLLLLVLLPLPLPLPLPLLLLLLLLLIPLLLLLLLLLLLPLRFPSHSLRATRLPARWLHCTCSRANLRRCASGQWLRSIAGLVGEAGSAGSLEPHMGQPRRDGTGNGSACESSALAGLAG